MFYKLSLFIFQWFLFCTNWVYTCVWLFIHCMSVFYWCKWQVALHCHSRRKIYMKSITTQLTGVSEYGLGWDRSWMQRIVYCLKQEMLHRNWILESTWYYVKQFIGATKFICFKIACCIIWFIQLKKKHGFHIFNVFNTKLKVTFRFHFEMSWRIVFTRGKHSAPLVFANIYIIQIDIDHIY